MTAGSTASFKAVYLCANFHLMHLSEISALVDVDSATAE